MLSYCLKCRENTETENPEVVRTKNERIMLLPKCTVCDGKKQEKEVNGLLSSLGITTPLNKVPFLSPLKLIQGIKLMK